jgi:hypothetical protein
VTLLGWCHKDATRDVPDFETSRCGVVQDERHLIYDLMRPLRAVR